MCDTNIDTLLWACFILLATRFNWNAFIVVIVAVFDNNNNSFDIAKWMSSFLFDLFSFSGSLNVHHFHSYRFVVWVSACAQSCGSSAVFLLIMDDGDGDDDGDGGSMMVTMMIERNKMLCYCNLNKRTITNELKSTRARFSCILIFFPS